MASPHVSVIIPNWNGQRFLPVCLEALRRQSYGAHEVILVDNASADDSVAYTRGAYPGVRVECLPRNVGFAGGVNAGIRAARGEYLALLNNDTEADPEWLAALVRALEEHPEIGFAASKMIGFHDRELLDGCGDALSWHMLAYKIGAGQRDAGQYETPRPVFGACAGAAIYRRVLFDTVGLFDEQFFAYYEDVDLSFRAQLAGFRCLYVPTAVVAHIGSATAGKESALFYHLWIRNRIYLTIKNLPLKQALRHAPRLMEGHARQWGRAMRHGFAREALRAHREALRHLPAMLRKRAAVQRLRRVSDSYLDTIIDAGHPFEKSFARGVLETVRRRAPQPGTDGGERGMLT
jgi:GT2 family glycosyltransferase